MKRIRSQDGKGDGKVPDYVSNKTSRYFVRSPSSSVGSVKSLGSLVDALCGHRRCFCYKCLVNAKPLTVDEKINAIKCHFHMCPVFNKSFAGCSTDWALSTGTCRKLEDNISTAVSHLCKYNCYLRAFAPAREWHCLRSTICHYANVSADKVLKGWSCFLAANKVTGDSERSLKPKVVFIAPNGRMFDNGERVLKALGLSECSTQRVYTKDLTEKTKKKVHPPLRSLRYSYRSIIEAEIVSSTPIHGIQCKREQSSAPKNCVKRLLYEEIKVSPCVLSTLRVSPFGLIEELFINDPWKLLVSTILLNRTCREQVDLVMFTLLSKYKDARSMENACPVVISNIIRPIGIRYRRAETLIRFSSQFNSLLKGEMNPTFDKKSTQRPKIQKTPFNLSRDEIIGLYGCGEYSADAYEVFIIGKHTDMTVSDHALQYYIDYKRGLSQEE